LSVDHKQSIIGYLFVLLLLAIIPGLARLSHGLGICPSVRSSHSWALSKRCKLWSRNLYRGLPL